MSDPNLINYVGLVAMGTGVGIGGLPEIKVQSKIIGVINL